MRETTAYQKLKEISLLLSGVSFGAAFLSIENSLKQNGLNLFIVSVILLLVGVGLIEWILEIYLSLILLLNKKGKLIGIYAPYEIDNDNSSWINLSERQLENMITRHKIRYCVFYSDRDFRKYPVIINPYGGAYPENNVATLESLNEIFSYVKNGGTYVNIADIPFYYAFDKSLNRRLDTTPFAGPFTRTVSFLHTILTKRLQVFVYGLSDKKYTDEGISRVISCNENSVNYFTEKLTIENEYYSPYLSIPYGRGFFVFSTKLIGKDEELHLVDIVNNSLELINL